MTTVEFEEGCSIDSIPIELFYGCTKLSSVNIPSTVKNIYRRAFRECGSLVTVVIPEGVVSIGPEAFFCCLALKNIHIPSSVETIGGADPVGDKVISELAFSRCENLETVTFGENSKLTKINDYTFKNCHKLKSISIPNGVTEIGTEAFYQCYDLASIYIPKSVTTIGKSAFAHTLASDCYYEGTEEEWGDITVMETEGSGLANANMHYNSASINEYAVTEIEAVPATFEETGNNGVQYSLDGTATDVTSSLLALHQLEEQRVDIQCTRSGSVELLR